MSDKMHALGFSLVGTALESQENIARSRTARANSQCAGLADSGTEASSQQP